MKKLEIYCDGGSRGNPGPSAFAFVVLDGGVKIYEASSYIGSATNNEAEYEGLLAALGWLDENIENYDADEVVIHLDSQLVVRQMNGVYKIKSKSLMERAVRARRLAKDIGKSVKIVHVTRDKNSLADKLLNEELDRISS